MTAIANAEVLRAARFMPFHHTRIEAVVMSLPLEHECSAHVIGDPENAAYEFVILAGDQIVECSNDGYGSPLVALRDALIAHCGMPEQLI